MSAIKGQYLTEACCIWVQASAREPAVSAPRNYADLSEAVDLFLELLFLENSRPLHSHVLVTCLRLPSLPPPPLPSPAGGAPASAKPTPPESERFSWLATRIAQLCQEYSEGGPKARRFALVGVTSSLIGAQFQPLLSSVTQRSALVIARELCSYVAFATRHVMSAVMDECQEALSALFFLQREYGDQMLGPGANRAFATVGSREAKEAEGEESRTENSTGFKSGGQGGRLQGSTGRKRVRFQGEKRLLQNCRRRQRGVRRRGLRCTAR